MNHGQNLDIIILVPKLQNEPMMTFKHLFSHVLWVTVHFLQLLLSKRPFAWEKENTPKSWQKFLLVFQQFKIKSAPSELACWNNNANLKG